MKKSFLWSPILTLSLFSHSAVSDSLGPHGLQQARPPCSSATPGTCSSSCPSNRWCHPTISSSVIPFSSCPQSFPASGSFPMSQLLASGSQGIGSFSFNAQAEAEIQTLDGAKFSLQVSSLVPTAISPADLGLHLRWESSREWATLDLLLVHQGIFQK